MKSGKLDEEPSRMSGIAEKIKSNSLALFNESFAATNEREGSEIARQIVSALLEKHIKVFFVTHLYEFAHSFQSRRMGNALFLRAERRADGGCTFSQIYPLDKPSVNVAQEKLARFMPLGKDVAQSGTQYARAILAEVADIKLERFIGIWRV